MTIKFALRVLISLFGLYVGMRIVEHFTLNAIHASALQKKATEQACP